MIEKLRKEKKSLFLEEKLFFERKAVKQIKTNCKYFYKYANSFKKVQTEPSILQDDKGELIMDKKVIADMLQQQFKSVFSNPLDSENYSPPFEKPTITHPLPDLEITTADIVKAINEIKTSSSCPKYEIPAKVFKECKHTLSVPLKMLWTESFETGRVPQHYKHQLVIPIYKKGPKTKCENFRPISLTAHTIKIFERILRDKLAAYFELNSLFNSNQHGFRRQRSCATQLLAHTNYIHSGLVEGSGVDSIYIDYAKAFDKVDHKVLLQKLKHYSVNDHYIEWIKSFLEGRFQTVNVDGFYSFPTPVLSGVPQGSVLGPLLFIIYLNDLSNEISGAEIQTFADDTKIVAKINTVDDKNNLQKNLDSVITWSQINNMKLNINKFELICHKSKTENKTLNLLNILPFSNSFNSYIATNSINIDPSSSVKDLGIVIDESLNWKLQIEVICKKSKQLSAWILSVFYTRDRLTMLTLFNALVRSRLEYCCEVWSPHQIQDIVKLEQLQRSFTHRISGMKDHNYWDRLEILKIMSLQRRREKIIIIHL